MSRLARFGRSFVVLSVLSVVVCGGLKAAEKTGADLLPNTTVLYAEVNAPGDIVDAIENHPLRKRLEKTDTFKQLTEENPDFLKARAGLGIVEFVVGRDWDEAITDIAGGGLYVGFDAATEGAIVLAHAPDKDTLAEIRDRVIKAAKLNAEREGKEPPLKEREYRGHKVYKADQAVVGVFGQWLIISNKPDLARAAADNLLDDGKNTLAASEKFQAARKSVVGKPIAWAYANVEALREANVAEALYRDKSDNPGVEILLGGVLETLKHTEAGTAALYLEDDQIRFALGIPYEASKIPEQRAFFFGEEGRGAAQTSLAPENQLLAITTYRDVGKMWRRRSDLFDENVNAGLAQADSNLSTVFAGLDFGREVLGALEPEVQIIAANQDYGRREGRQPSIKLPAFAMVLQLKEPEKMQRQLKVSFQSLIGLTNLGAGQNDLPQLELKTEQLDDGRIVSATYENLPDDEEVSNDIIYNFSPALAFVDNHFIVSSTRDLAVELMALAQGEGKPLASNGRVVNTRIQINSGALRSLLEANREALIAQNMLEEGNTRKQSETEIGLLFALMELAGDASVELATGDGALQLEVSLGIAGE